MKGSVLAWVLIAAATATANADVLLLETIEAAPPNSASGVMRPQRGASMSQVRAQFGEPGTMMDAVGDPPITRWVYPAYTVYFEHDQVLDAVVHRNK
ncbi:MAG: hypothetical protein WBM59_08050 [Sedimenticolaceae bacterium]|jgi:hypothetical protein